MRLSKLGNLLIGSSTDAGSGKLQVAGAITSSSTITASTSVKAPIHTASAAIEFKPGSDSTTAIKLENSSGSAVATVDTTNKLFGIGTTPSTLLHLSAINPSLRIDAAASSSNGAYLNLHSSGVASGHDYFVGSALGSDGAGLGKCYVYDSTSSATRFVIDTSGNFGIGALFGTGNNPSAPLHILNSAATMRIESTSSASNGAYFQLRSSAAGGGHDYFIGSGLGGDGAGAGKFYVYDNTSSAQRMVIDTSGNIGIGTTSPSAGLDVNAASIRIETSHTPAGSSESCAAGTINWDSSYVYVCVATNTWSRATLASF